MEEGLRWKDAGSSRIPAHSGYSPEGVFISVPQVYGRGQFDLFLEALRAEAAYVLGDARPGWVHLYGAGIYELPMGRVRDVAQAACPGAALGLELDPALLELGAVAGYRSVGVERFFFRIVAPGAGMDDPVRRARALGAFSSAEACYGGPLAGRPYLQAVERLLAASPDQIVLSDVRSRGAFGAEMLEKAGELCAAAGYGRASVWLWAKNGACFDSLALMLSGRCAGLGPGAVNCRGAVYANPDVRLWMQSRLSGSFDAACAGGRLEQWLSLAAGLYRLELRRENLDSRMYRHAFALERTGIVDRKGHPAAGWPMEFCHRAARAARQALGGGSEYDVPAARFWGDMPVVGRGE
jgi:hypothetical protein